LAAWLVAQSPDATIFADTDGVIRVWNTAASRVFGFQPDEVIGSNLDIIIPERFREAHWRGFERAISDAASKYVGEALPTRATRADGNTLYVEMSFAVIVDDDGTAVGALAQARDITERFMTERSNRKRMDEMEQALAKQGGA